MAVEEVRLVVVETPFAHKKGDRDALKRVLRYMRAALRDCLMRGEAPFASHAIYTQPGVLDDHVPEQRDQGIEAGLAWGERADARVVYGDLGISGGMAIGIAKAERLGQPIEYRRVPGWSEA